VYSIAQQSFNSFFQRVRGEISQAQAYCTGCAQNANARQDHCTGTDLYSKAIRVTSAQVYDADQNDQ